MSISKNDLIAFMEKIKGNLMKVTFAALVITGRNNETNRLILRISQDIEENCPSNGFSFSFLWLHSKLGGGWLDILSNTHKSRTSLWQAITVKSERSLDALCQIFQRIEIPKSSHTISSCSAIILEAFFIFSVYVFFFLLFFGILWIYSHFYHFCHILVSIGISFQEIYDDFTIWKFVRFKL